MFESIESPRELFTYQLGAALTMEQTVLDMLGQLETVKKADDGLVDAVILSGAADTEHHEISVYEGLITKAEAMGEQDIVALLQENLEQEQHTLEEVKRASRQLAQEQARQVV